MAGESVFIPETLAEFFTTSARLPDALIFAGGTDILRTQAGRMIVFPRNVISIREIDEISEASRTERYLDLGAAMTIAEVADLGEKVVPPVLYETLKLFAVPGIRNLATVGGNLLCTERRMDLFVPLSILDARVEVRRATGSRWIPLSRLVAPDGRIGIDKGEIVAHIRIPSDLFELNLARKVGSHHYPDPATGVFCCCAKTSKGILSDFRLAFAGERYFRSRDIENVINGKNLPLTDRDVETVLDAYREELAEDLGPTLRQQFVNLTGWALSYLTEKGYE
jgi:xanthine dehydrogenase FAD-binding subunit